MNDAQRTNHVRFFAILTIFVLSGATGLVYQVLWARLLTVRVFGTTTHAISAVLTAFMMGLAIGAYWLGRRADHQPRPLRMYALLEVGIGVYAFLFPVILNSSESIYLIFAKGRDPNVFLNGMRFLLAGTALILPTTLMGATLPAMIRFVTKLPGQLGKQVGFLYAANTVGAVIGTLLTAFLFIRAFGVNATMYGAGALNLILAAAAWWIDRSSATTDSSPTVETDAITPEQEAAYSPQLVSAATAAFALSGFCALAYEVLWTRILVFFLGSTTFAFATMLSAFLVGIAAGSALLSRFVVGNRNLPLWLGYAQAVIAIAAVLLLPAFGELYTIVSSIGVGGRVMVFLVCVALMLVPTLMMGATFPIVAQIAAGRSSGFAHTVGNIYALNTVGAILGSLIAGWVLIPTFGIRNGILLVAMVNLVAAGWVLKASPSIRSWERWTPTVAGIIFVAIGFFFFPKTQFFKKSAIYQEQFTRFNLDADILKYDENADASVTVIRDPEGAKRLYVDTNEAANDTRWDAPSHRVIAHVPLLLHPDPKQALVIGFGMGRTSNSIIQHGVEVDAAEIAPGVPRAAREFFTDANDGVLDSTKFHLHINDGRNYILTTNRTYDMISTGIIHPLVSSGSSSIYSRDFYELCESILTDDGVMSQWVPLHRLPLSHLKTIIRTFLDVFPNTTVWYKYTPDFLILVGTKSPQSIDIQRWIDRTRNAAVDADLAKDDLETWSLLDSFLMDAESAREFVGVGPLHTDDKPVLEFFGANLGDITTTQVENINALRPYRKSVMPLLTGFSNPQEREVIQQRLATYFAATQLLIEGQAHYAGLDYNRARVLYEEALTLNPDPTIAYNLREVAIVSRQGFDEGLEEFERPLLEQLRQDPNDVEALINLALVYRSVGQLDKSVLRFEQALRIDPRNIQVLLAVGETYQHNGDMDKALDSYNKALGVAKEEDAPTPVLTMIQGSLASMYSEAGRLDEAAVAVREVLRFDPTNARAYAMLGAIHLTKEEYGQAEAMYVKVLSLNAEPVVRGRAWNDLGIVRTELGRYDEAVEAFENALKIDPNFAEAQSNLSQVRQMSGK